MGNGEVGIPDGEAGNELSIAHRTLADAVATISVSLKLGV